MCPYVSSGKISLRVTARRRLPLQDSLPTYHTSGQHMCSSVASAHASCCAFCADAPTPLISGASRQLPGHSVAMRCMYIGMYLCMYGNTYINVCMHGRYWETHSHVCLHACAQVSVHVCICVCMYSVCMYVFYDCRCVLVCVCHTRAGMSGDATKEWLRIHDVQELTAAAAASASISGLFSQGEGPSKGRS